MDKRTATMRLAPMARVRIYEDLDHLFSEKMKQVLLSQDDINMPDWIDDMASWIVTLSESVLDYERPGLIQFAHERIDYHVRAKGKN